MKYFKDIVFIIVGLLMLYLCINFYVDNNYICGLIFGLMGETCLIFDINEWVYNRSEGNKGE